MKRILVAIQSLWLLAAGSSVYADTILMFVAHEQTYYSEYIVMKEALEAAGYVVDVRSATTSDFSIYMTPYDDLQNAANNLDGSSYAEFQSQFLGLFGVDWKASNNSIPDFAIVKGSLLDVEKMDDYVGMVVVGGTGSLSYRVDGDYVAQGDGERLVSAQIVQQTSEHLNALAVEAMVQGKPVMAQCHGASLPAFWRIPNTSGSNYEALGYSLLKGEISAGYPESITSQTLANLDVTYRPEDRVTISSPHSTLEGGEAGAYKIITTRDWFPQTVAHAARTFLNVLETHPNRVKKNADVSTLLIHGGAIDPEDCGADNKENDVPCNHGLGENLPADYRDLISLLNDEDAIDGLSIVADHIHLEAEESSLPFDPTDEEEILTYLSDYEVVVFFKHWSTYLTDEMLQAIVTFADQGGGVIGLHHALYNDEHEGQNKDILVTELFGAQSALPDWAANLTNFDMYATDHGHFISSYLIEYDEVSTHPQSWGLDPLASAVNHAYSTLPFVNVYDELYVDFSYTGDIPVGRGLNRLTPLFSNNALPPHGEESQTRQTGFTHQYDGDEDGVYGKVAYISLGERKDNMKSASTYGQMIRNAVVWAKTDQEAPEPEKMEQTISIESIEGKLVNDIPFELVASTNSGLDLSYAVVSGPATNDGPMITLTGETGTVILEVTQVGNEDFLSASESVYFNVTDPAKQSQTITFDTPADRTYGDAPFFIEVSSSSGLDVDVIILSGSAMLDDNMVTMTGAGTVVILASQSGNDTYNPATSVERSFEVGKAEQIITFTPINDMPMFADPVSLEAESSSGLEVSFEVEGPAAISESKLTLEGTAGTVKVTAVQSGNENYHAASVQQSFEAEFVLDVRSQLERWIVYPNPSGNLIQIESNSFGEARIELYSLGGELIHAKRIESRGVFDLQAFQEGLYFLRVIEKENTTTTKILIQR